MSNLRGNCRTCGGVHGPICPEGQPAPTPERPTTEEGEEELAVGYVAGLMRTPGATEKIRLFNAALWGLREGKRLERERHEKDLLAMEDRHTSGTMALIRERDAAVTRMHEQDTWAAVCMEERDAAQEAVRKLKDKNNMDRAVCILRDEIYRLGELLVEAEDWLRHDAPEHMTTAKEALLARLRSGKDGGGRMNERKVDSMVRRLRTMANCGLGPECKVCRRHAEYIRVTLKEEMQPKTPKRSR